MRIFWGTHVNVRRSSKASSAIRMSKIKVRNNEDSKNELFASSVPLNNKKPNCTWFFIMLATNQWAKISKNVLTPQVLNFKSNISPWWTYIRGKEFGNCVYEYYYFPKISSTSRYLRDNRASNYLTGKYDSIP